MATPKVVNGAVLRADGTPRAVVLVRAKLSQGVTIAGTQEVVPLEVTTKTAVDGSYSLSLFSNSDLTPSGTYYTITEDAQSGDLYQFAVIVPGTAGPFNAAAIQVAPPAPSPPAALDSAVVHNTGAEAVAGVKTFSSAPVVPAAAFPESAVASLVADLTALTADDANAVHKTGTESIAGQKTFSGRHILTADFVHSYRTATEAELVSGLDASLAETVYVPLTISRVMGAPINPVAGHRLKVVFTQPAGGNCTVTLPAAVVAPAWTANLGANAITELPIEYNGTTSKWVFASNPASALASTVTTPAAGSTVAGLYDNGSMWFNGSASKYGTVAAPNGGLRVDGVTDDTADWQAFSDFLTGKTPGTGQVAGLARCGVIKAGVSLISASVSWSQRPGAGLRGAGRNASIIRQATDNTPIFTLGGDGASNMHSFLLDGLQFDYTNSQPSTNATATPLLVNGVYESSFTNLFFNRGSYAIKSAAGFGAALWGCYFNNLWFSSGLTKGAIDTTGATGAYPSNNFGHIMVSAGAMVGPIFALVNQTGLVWGNLEVDTCSLGPQVFSLSSGTVADIREIHLEGGTYTASQVLIDIGPNSHVQIGELDISGFAISGGTTYVKAIRCGNGGGGGHLFVDAVDVSFASNTMTGLAAVIVELDSGGSGQPVGIIGNVYLGTAGWVLVDQGGFVTGENLKVLAWNQGTLSQNKGDASYVVVLGDPNTLSFETAFTAIRNVDLPSVNNNLHNGLVYRIRGYGAVNGANTMVIRCNGATKQTITVDKTVAEYTYRRNVANPQGGWINTAQYLLP